MARTRSIGMVSSCPGSAATTDHPRCTRWSIVAVLKIGSVSTAPAVARTTLGLNTSTESGVSQSAVTPRAAAVLTIAPRFAGSRNDSPSNPSATGCAMIDASFHRGCDTIDRIPGVDSISENRASVCSGHWYTVTRLFKRPCWIRGVCFERNDGVTTTASSRSGCSKSSSNMGLGLSRTKARCCSRTCLSDNSSRIRLARVRVKVG